jgi:hypothetical protein
VGKADLEAHEPLSPEEMPTARWAAAFDEEVAKYSAEDAATNGGQMVDAAVAGAVTAASERVKAASLTAEQRMARAIAVELKGQILETDTGDLYVPTEDDIDHEAELEAFLRPRMRTRFAVSTTLTATARSGRSRGLRSITT